MDKGTKGAWPLAQSKYVRRRAFLELELIALRRQVSVLRRQL